jgi:DNA-binding XRE family transcriptional regulator
MTRSVQKAVRFEDLLKRELRNPAERRAYEKGRKGVFLAYRILCLRQDLGMTQVQLARRMGTSQQAISRLESGDYEGFTLRTLGKLAHAMGAELVLDLKRKSKAS